ncbi:hypothetical protein EON80_05975, partial [bacterium]
MNRIIFALALLLPISAQGEKNAVSPQSIEVVGPSVLMNEARLRQVAIFDLRSQGRSVPGATRDLKATVPQGAPVFVIGEPGEAQQWADERQLESVQV